ncbi:hypothetical protein [Celeribacter indicus]|uniref:Uncharacterized protein n=1 Tax=Celeribacter indicus TaxID=1208324 RepID=A0A0B5DZH7_9RHOB|nr:hypothetical protein [Celeribacter indicus]AJE48858.1 hypothetical protein P73_4143 [Celeribacter indicus]SDW39344.1 hypothetical protein SAMN05443573_10363 [Celeribacter indicus]
MTGKDPFGPAAAILRNMPGMAAGTKLEGPLWLAWRRNGKLIQGGWYENATLGEAIATAGAVPGADRATAAELCLTRDYRDVAPEAFGRVFSNGARGRTGIEIRAGKFLHRVPPTLTIATNRSFRRELELFVAKTGLEGARLAREARLRAFSARKILVRLGQTAPAVEIYRANQIVPPEAAGRALLEDCIRGMADWMLGNLADDGRMTYKYWPSRGTCSSADNTIRQFMATVALGRIARRGDHPQAAEAFRRNLRHNLGLYYREVEGIGTIILDGKAKLGAVALAALAIAEGRHYGLIAPDAHQDAFAGLNDCIDRLWQPDGAFRTFLVPRDRNDNQNFYPGEALLYWATLYRTARRPELLERCLKSFSHYRDWHRRFPNPAFVPWHTQACKMLHDDTQKPELADFIFERNDWLLGMQQWEGSVAPDFHGRFHDPKRPEYGPPHSSATGVYMEGLADAWQLAHSLGDRARAGAYAAALTRGLRNIAQLQFRDPEIDAFYITRKAAVMGAIRTEMYNNEIRVDNVQHCLMALMKIAAAPDFPLA